MKRDRSLELSLFRRQGLDHYNQHLRNEEDLAYVTIHFSPHFLRQFAAGLNHTSKKAREAPAFIPEVVEPSL